ncbi:DUF3365 domain-containing protein [Chitinibacter bivalviorum]|uniref:DUF3365 domain-containing protein n=1 Tax=Chitinibacter bivalviorum TaxID=2739434 RepID=A0A7H9BGN3_9NEIS|nr:DUF3365 domain-containing protein [Chitinibacter bivalviorum]QLG87368.1 DUF3365 domain-containing protein [Chitinibacter bivalviorum]
MNTTIKTLVVLVAALLLAFTLGKSIYEKEQLNQARTVANMVEHIGQWASQYRGVWIKEGKGQAVDLGSHLDTLTVTLANNDNSVTSQEQVETTLDFHLKNPALIQREISDLMQKNQNNTSYRITSDKYMNPKNSPTVFETDSIENMRKNNTLEYSEVKNGTLHYARALIATEACMRCHASAEKAPNSVRNLYPTQGYGYELGKVAGVISVTVPTTYSATSIFSAFDLLSLLTLLGVGLISFWVMRKR